MKQIVWKEYMRAINMGVYGENGRTFLVDHPLIFSGARFFYDHEGD